MTHNEYLYGNLSTEMILNTIIVILGNPGLQRGRDGKGRERLGAGKRWGEGRGRERGKGKPWEASLYRSFLDQLLF